MAPTHTCSLKDLPRIEGQPQGCAWGYYAKDKSKRDELGTLNLLTQEVVADAAKAQIQTGARVQLDWSLNNLEFPAFQRAKFEQKVIDKCFPEKSWIGNDDEISFNTQCGSQWDGFRHVAHRVTTLYYGGLTHKQIQEKGSTGNGIGKWCEGGGIAGRGVLLDWVRWWEKTKPGVPLPSAVVRSEIPLKDLKEVAKFQGVEFKPGDILIVRTGFVRWHNGAGPEERKRYCVDKQEYLGVQASEEALDWFWENRFAAVGGDAVAFEAWPPADVGGVCLHEWFLSLWGTPIGEMWNLEELSAQCEQHKRWTFFLTSAPLNVPGGVGSPPNAVAIF